MSGADFKGKTYWRETKRVLHDHQNGKCCFCERRRDPNAEGDVEHFRPKLKVTENPQHGGYWWLAYEWSNLLFSCKACNSENKKNYFPLANEADRAATANDDLSLERPMLINPSYDDPADYIDYDWDTAPEKVLLLGRDSAGRGSKTIHILGLIAREDLHKRRIEILLTLQLLDELLQELPPGDPHYQRAVAELRRKAVPDQEHLGLIQYYVRRQGLEHLVNE